MNRFKTRKIVCFALAMCGVFTTIGTGFCLWVFIDPDDEKTHVKAQIPLEVSSYTDIGTFDARSLQTKGTISQAKEKYLFPEMLVMEEGHGTINDLSKGLNFYKKVYNPDGNEYPVFETPEPFLDDEVKITFYKDNDITNQMAHEQGLRFNLYLDVGITTYLNEFITVLDNFQAKEFPLTDNDEVTVVGKQYHFNYTYFSKAYDNDPDPKDSKPGEGYLGQDIIDELNANKIEGNITEPRNIIPDHKYIKYVYIMNFSKIFRYTSIHKKPITIEAYKAFEELAKKKNEHLSFKFSASYGPIVIPLE